MKIYNNDSTLTVMQACIRQRIPVLLRGETGTGKTTIVKHLTEEAGKTLTRINLTGQTTREDLIGKYILKNGNLEWQDGPLATALRKGHWILLDEINAALPEVLFVLQSLLESDGKLGNVLLVEKDGEMLVPHEDSIIFATCNPSEYEGVKEINMATLSRFAVIDIEPLDYIQEEQLLKDRYDSSISRKLVLGAKNAREQKQKGETTLFISTRDLELACRLHKEGIEKDEAITIAILSKCQNAADRIVIEKCFSMVKVEPSPTKKSFLEEMEDLQKENQELQKNQWQVSELLATLKKLASKLQIPTTSSG